MKRSCKVCRKNNNEAFHSCGYIPKNKRSNKKTDFPLYNNHNFYVNICPVWYFNTFSYFYTLYNYIKSGIKKNLTWHDRYIYKIAEGYNNLQEKDRIDKINKELKARKGGF